MVDGREKEGVRGEERRGGGGRYHGEEERAAPVTSWLDERTFPWLACLVLFLGFLLSIGRGENGSSYGLWHYTFSSLLSFTCFLYELGRSFLVVVAPFFSGLIEFGAR